MTDLVARIEKARANLFRAAVLQIEEWERERSLIEDQAARIMDAHDESYREYEADADALRRRVGELEKALLELLPLAEGTEPESRSQRREDNAIRDRARALLAPDTTLMYDPRNTTSMGSAGGGQAQTPEAGVPVKHHEWCDCECGAEEVHD